MGYIKVGFVFEEAMNVQLFLFCCCRSTNFCSRGLIDFQMLLCEKFAKGHRATEEFSVSVTQCEDRSCSIRLRIKL